MVWEKGALGMNNHDELVGYIIPTWRLLWGNPDWGELLVVLNKTVVKKKNQRSGLIKVRITIEEI